MTEQEKQIIELNRTVKCTLALSKIHGIGVFAIRDIKRGEKLYCIIESPERKWYTVLYKDFDKLIPEVKDLILQRWPAVVNGSPFLSPNEVYPSLFMNHSEDPNYRSLDDTALRDIYVGEEVTEDYGQVPNLCKIFPFLKN